MHVWISSFAIAAAFFVVGGFLLLQWQKNRYRYQLLRIAVERGDPMWSFDTVDWLGSLRRAVATLVLGIGLACIGTFLWTQRPLAAPPPERMAETNSAETGHRSDVSVTEQVAHMIGVNQPKRPPHKSPEHEAWERLQKQQAIGLSFLGAGVLLVLIGTVNCGFAWIERQTAFSNEVMYEIDPSPPHTPTDSRGMS